ncbi:MAG: hypothetical protein CVU71_13350 [Deltaproteobacteria bacterium HGW-Deltaproteobacteria-6]|jgi:hypothetical protein|nr:MAG: hypothetical protein CVU71_13350 [Deltaproteobacteria bacterium HGW-Deltaproteobacteria-6]
MKPSAAEITINPEKISAAPVVSFSHLSSCFASEAILNDDQSTIGNFSAPQEEALYETGYLLKIFLRC